jgi:hypothetical protein
MLWGRMRTALEAPEAFAASSYCCCAVIVNEMRQEKVTVYYLTLPKRTSQTLLLVAYLSIKINK